ncbi:hypothetical protein Ddc_20231 [Ditylenchus destructor]|nr:hypothetical protein Ddc_20231 [Ditylenchus destructor]
MSTAQFSIDTKVFLPPRHLTYFTFADNALPICFHIITVLFNSHILYCYYFKRNRLKTSNLASSLLVFLWTHVICAISDMPYHTYVVVKWNPANQENYDPYVLYWTGISVNIYYNLTSLSVLLLSLDRLLILRFFYQYKKKNMEKWFPRVTILFLLGYSIFLTVAYVYCQPQSCVASTRYTIVPNVRILIIIINVLASAYFLWTFRSVSKKEKVNIRVVKMTIALEIALNAFPDLIIKLLITAMKFDLYGNVGPIATVLTTANIAFSAAYTWFILVGRSKEAVISVVSNTQIKPRIMPIT